MAIKVNKNGEQYQELTWEIPDIVVGKPMEKIHFSSTIGTIENPKIDVKDGQTLSNVVKSSSNNDSRKIMPSNYNIDNADIVIIKNSPTSVIKNAIKPVIELSGTIGFNLAIATQVIIR
ncbi:hypothetical protein MGH68_01950 [Erysipelothrix sp. D19-032]